MRSNASHAFIVYSATTRMFTPLMPLLLRLRARKGKEEKPRLAERFGHASAPRPAGKLLWIHAASIGEAQSVLGLIDALKEAYPQLSILMTTGTVTSAKLMKERLPADVIHQYVPVDTPAAVSRFIAHWKPDAAFWVESEFWPNLVYETERSGCRMALINARMSQRSFEGWQKTPELIAQMLKSFMVCFAQSESDATRLKLLGAPEAWWLGNLKYDAAPLKADEEKLAAFTEALAARPCWLAASTHPGEEAIIARVHARLKTIIPDVLTVIVPRHPKRGEDIIKAMQAHFASLRVEQRSKDALPQADTDIYLADTLGELGLFYRACRIAFMGGSLVKHGGQNPLEPARLSCAVVYGPHMENFATVRSQLFRQNAAVDVVGEAQLGDVIAHLLQHPDEVESLGKRAKIFTDVQRGTTERLLKALAPLLGEEAVRA